MRTLRSPQRYRCNPTSCSHDQIDHLLCLLIISILCLPRVVSHSCAQLTTLRQRLDESAAESSAAGGRASDLAADAASRLAAAQAAQLASAAEAAAAKATAAALREQVREVVLFRTVEK